MTTTTSRPKIAIVGGLMSHGRQLHIFADLQGQFDINVYAIESKNIISSFPKTLKLKLFENLPDMPGYMRALEEHVSSCDLMVILETSRLTSFQGVRIARKYQIPCICLVNEFHPFFYANYPNIRAVQTDVFAHADRFLASSKLAMDMLRVENIPDGKIRSLPVRPNSSFFNHDERARTKFRKHVGIAEDDRVILLKGDLEEWVKPRAVLEALSLLFLTNPTQMARTKLLFAGDGSLAKELKYRCHDLKLGRSVLFLHQNSEPFIKDLYNACDVMVHLRRQRSDFHEEFPLEALEAMACGVIPIYSMGSVLAEYAQNNGIGISDDTHQSIAAAFAKLLNDEILTTQREKLAKVFDRDDLRKVQKVLADELMQLVEEHQQVHKRWNVDAAASDCEQLITRGEAEKAVEKIEELWLNLTQVHEKDGRTKAHLLRIKGDALASLNRLEEGMEAYNTSITLDDRRPDAFRGLGYIALKGHAHDEAITFFKKALGQKADDFDSLLGVGLVHRRLGLNEHALFWLEKCLILDRHHTGAMTAFLQACMECPKPQEAIHILERLMEQQGEDSASMLMTLGQLYVKSGDTVTGNGFIQKALALGDAAVVDKAS